MSPVPAPAPLAAFFFLSGIGTAFEMAFRRVTGRRVRGLAGRVWTWTYMLVTARLAVRAWLDSGVGGSFLTPSNTSWTPADFVAKWIVKSVVHAA